MSGGIGGLPLASTSVIPQGVGGPPPPGVDSKKGKLMCIKVRMLDDTVGVFHLGHKADGKALFDEVCRHLNLLETDYFGLEFYDGYGNRCWLDFEKTILKQITQTRSDARFYFVVKFYTPDPEDLEEEYTRYLFALQIKRDLATGQLPCNDNTAALMASYIVQAECGDYSPEDYPDHSYLQSAKFVPKQDAEFERKVMENHKKHIGISPAEADVALLMTARRCEFYGVKMHPAKDHEGMPLCLSVTNSGLNAYQGLTKINTFSWAKVRKLSFKKRRFLVKLHPDSYQFYKDTVEFYFESRNEAKMFWKKCIEYHSFFRCSSAPKETPRAQSKLFTKGSSFRYCGRTQRQLVEYIREHQKRREPFTRPVVHSSNSRPGTMERKIHTPMVPIPLSRQNGDAMHEVLINHHSLPSVVQPSTSFSADDVRSHAASPLGYNLVASPTDQGTPRISHRPVYYRQQQQMAPNSSSMGTKGAVISFHVPADDGDELAGQLAALVRSSSTDGTCIFGPSEGSVASQGINNHTVVRTEGLAVASEIVVDDFVEKKRVCISTATAFINAASSQKPGAHVHIIPPPIVPQVQPPNMTDLEVPAIQIESEDHPGVQHRLLNGDIPYVLHMRQVVDEKPPLSTFKEAPGTRTIPSDLIEGEVRPTRTRNPAGSGQRPARQKSVEFVSRKRLPSPASYSSQDHSISPDSDADVLGYILRKRGDSISGRRGGRRGDPKRFTQPSSIVFRTDKKPEMGQSQPNLPIDGDDEDSGDNESYDLNSLHGSMDLLDKMPDSASVDSAELTNP